MASAALAMEDVADVEDVKLFPPAIRMHYAALAHQLVRLRSQRQFYELFPDKDTVDDAGTVLMHARRKYARHLEFFGAGGQYRERAFIAANRVGKTTAGAYEMTCHLTGNYPHWWDEIGGRRFHLPIKAWAAGKDTESTRDTVQEALLGPLAMLGSRKTLAGTGMVPGMLLGQPTWKKSAPDLVDHVKVKHASGGWSRLGIKTYEQKMGSFMGTAQEVIWLDEECPVDIYGECLMRTMTTHGIVMLTFTPLFGISPTVQQFQLDEHRAILGGMR